MTTLVWIQREFRVDHAPVIQAALECSDKVILAYFHDESQVIGEANSAWLAQSLLSFKEALKTHSADLWMIEGDFQENLSRLITEQNIQQVYYSYQVGSPFAQMQQTALDVCKGQKVALTPFYTEFLLEPDCMLNKQNRAYLVYTPFYKNFLSKQFQIETVADLSQYQQQLKLAGLVTLPKAYANLPSTLQNILAQPWAKKILAHWQVGEKAAWQTLQKFIEEEIADYSNDRDFPAIIATSTLSSYLHYGEISIRAIYFYVQTRVEQGELKADIAQPWLRQLVWKEFARHLLHWFPETEAEPFQKKYLEVKWPYDAYLVNRWQTGQTGIPIIDAGMRELWETGIMHNRVRMLVASFLTKNLNQNWVLGKQWFDNTLLDADPANNVMGWQWVAGCGVDAAPYYRLFNPVTQSQKFDKHGDYIKHWLPELKSLSNKAIHEPWAHKLECEMKGIVLGEHYPKPLVDLKQSREAHLARVNEMKVNRQLMSNNA